MSVSAQHGGNTEANDMDEERIAREPERKRITGVCRTAWWAAERRGVAPRRVQLLGGRVGWRVSELYAWVLSRRPRS